MWRLIKLVLWVIPLLLLAGAIGLLLWYKRDVHGKETRDGGDLKELRTAKVEKYDFGMEKFDAAVAMLRDGKDEDARKALMAMLRYHKDSARATDAMHIVGQMNLDRLFDPAQPFPGKQRVEIEKGGSINKLAATTRSSYHYIVRANGLTRPEAVQPNEQLWTCPLEFRVVVDAGAKHLRLMDGDRFFALFPILEIRRPQGSKLPVKSAVGQKFSSRNGKRVLLTEDDGPDAEKWIEIGRDWAIRSVPPGAKPGQGFGIFIAETEAADLVAVLRSGNPVEIIP